MGSYSRQQGVGRSAEHVKTMSESGPNADWLIGVRGLS